MSKFGQSKHILLFISLACWVTFVCAQKQGQARIDSLIPVLNKSIPDTMRLKVLSDLATLHMTNNTNRGVKYALDMLDLAHKMRNRRFEGLANMNLGTLFLSKTDLIKSLDYFNKAMAIFVEIKSERDQAKVLNNLGNYWDSRLDIDKAYDHYKRAYTIYLKFNMRKESAITLGNIGRIHQAKALPDSALQCFSAAYEIFTTVNDSNGIARMLANMGNIYDLKGQFEKGLQLKFKSASIYARLNDRTGLARVYNNIAYSYLYASAETNKKSTPDSLKNRTILLNKSKYFIDLAIAINRSMGNKGYLVSDYRLLTDIFYELGDYKQSLITYFSSVSLKDSLFSDENVRKLTAMEVKSAEELKQKEIEIKNIQLSNIKKERWYYITGILIVLGFSYSLFKGFKNLQKSNNLLAIEKQKSEDLLLNILPFDVAEELKENGFTTARQYQEVTVLFSDIVNFTQLSEQLGAEILVQEINAYFSAFDVIMSNTGLEKIKTIGDAYIAADGLNNELISSPARVIRTALAMQEKIREFKDIRILAGKPWFEIRVGINTGPVVAGVVGIKKFQYDIWGDTVNTAARLESSCEAGKINISKATYDLIKNEFICEHRGEIDVKHKLVIDMYYVIGTV